MFAAAIDYFIGDAAVFMDFLLFTLEALRKKRRRSVGRMLHSFGRVSN